MSNGLLYIAGLISLALAALFAVPYFIDWNGYRGVFEEEATRILGREVRVGGDVNVRFLPSPYVSFEKLRIADPTGLTGELKAESIDGPFAFKGLTKFQGTDRDVRISTGATEPDGGIRFKAVVRD